MRVVYVVFFILGFVLNSNGQKYFKDFAPSVGLISYIQIDSPKMEFFGTGSLIIKIRDSAHALIFLVTNKHVLPTIKESNSITFRIRSKINQIDSFVSIEIPIFKNGKLSPEVKIDSKGEDVAVINVSGFFNSHQLEFSKHLFPYDLLVAKDTLKKLERGIGDEVVFIGFPSFFYNKKNISPILRVGIIATDPLEDFYFSDELKRNHLMKTKSKLPEKINGFLIDANVYGGSSGSLVLLNSQIFIINSDGRISYNTQLAWPYILGITTTSYFDMDARSANGVRLNLGGVISSEVIKRTIDLFEK